MFNVYKVTVTCTNDYSRQFNFKQTYIIVAVDRAALDEAIILTYNFEAHRVAGSKLDVDVEVLYRDCKHYATR